LAKYLKYNLKLVKRDSINIYDHVINLPFDANGSLTGGIRTGYSRSKEKSDPHSFQIEEKILCGQQSLIAKQIREIVGWNTLPLPPQQKPFHLCFAQMLERLFSNRDFSGR
jgi:hypothetical protein